MRFWLGRPATVFASCAAPLRVGLLGLLGVVAGCGSSSETARDDERSVQSATKPNDDASSEKQSSFGSSTEGTGPKSVAECTEAAKLVYVLSNANDLYSFSPSTLAFVKIGGLACGARGGSKPNSMAVDRSATAWVNYDDGSLWKVDTQDASCEKTSFKLDSDKPRMGMAFATDTKEGPNESLFVAPIFGTSGFTGDGLYRLDTKSLALRSLGDFSGKLAGHAGEFTGTGDARLYGFFATSPASLAEVDRTTGATTNVKSLPGVQVGAAFAFSFWGGDFWFYTAQSKQPSKVTRLHAATDQSLEVVLESVGDFEIVGAGVSTCAPTAPVK